MNVNRYGNVVHNTGIKDNNNQIDTWWCFKSNTIKFVKLSIIVLIVLTLHFVEWDTIGKDIDELIFRG